MDYVALLTYLIVMIITPGPNNIMLAASGVNFGFKRTMPHMTGIVAGGTLQTALCCLGLGTIFISFPILHSILLWAGIAYMLYLSWKLLGVKLGSNKTAQEPISFKQAFLFQFINPKSWVVTVTLASVFMPPNMGLWIPTLIISTCVVLVEWPCVAIWALFGKSMRNVLKTEKNQRIFNYVMAALLVITAIMIVVD